MQAATYARYGGPEVITVQDLPVPEPDVGEVLLRVAAAAVNPYDFHFLRGEPLFMRLFIGFRPRSHRLGRDVAGVVDAVGPGVDLAVGDAVFGAADGSFAEYAVARADQLAKVPAEMSFEEAAGLGMAGVTALQGWDEAGLAAGQRVLVNGASGGIGHLAVQIAKARGAHVTAVCKTENVGWVGELADVVIDYTAGSMLHGGPYDIVLDTVGNHAARKCLQVVKPGGAYVALGWATMGHVMGPLPQIAAMRLGPKRGRKVYAIDAKYTRARLEALAELASAGMKLVIEQVVPLTEVGQAIAHVEAGHTKGKTIITP